ncbi:MAG: hypothetical protein KKB70_01310, partial [Proteobacteria bacterium]|nr:hypothetical protein [Pseudomonadota bacterium]
PVTPVVTSGKVVEIERRVNVRAQRTASSSLVTTLAPGDKVRLDLLEKGWYAVFQVKETSQDPRKALGYLYAPMLGEKVETPTVHPLQPGEPTLAAGNEQSVRTSPFLKGPMDSPAMTPPVQTVPPTRENEPAAAPEAISAVATSPDGKQSMAINPRDDGDEPHKGPVPRADKVRHGYKYAMLERVSGTNVNLGRLMLKVFLDVNVIPSDESLKDFVTTLFKEEMGDSKELMIYVYLPGQDFKDLSYCQAAFIPQGIKEFWVRRATLFGTRLMP